MATVRPEDIEKFKSEGRIIYSKICKNPKCNCEFFADSRNQRYCSQECSDYMNEVGKKKAKHRKIKRKEYSENKEINRALSKAYSLCETVFELYQIPKVCACEGPDCKGALERNHKDLNPFNNAPWNLEYRCKSHHKAYHDQMGDVNMVDTYNEAVDAAGFEDEDKKHTVIIEYTKRKIEEARK